MKDRVVFLPRGKMLGGCSSSNCMVYVRGHPGVYGYDAVVAVSAGVMHVDHASRVWCVHIQLVVTIDAGTFFF